MERTFGSPFQKATFMQGKNNDNNNNTNSSSNISESRTKFFFSLCAASRETRYETRLGEARRDAPRTRRDETRRDATRRDELRPRPFWQHLVGGFLECWAALAMAAAAVHCTGCRQAAETHSFLSSLWAVGQPRKVD